ncbi:hypothetical protein N9N32_00025 [Alphaproteobacteria bacterium]|nr:hypothetical protein [Alphaproteobacteria bacterium]
MRISNISAFAGGADDVVCTQLVNGSARNWDIDLTDSEGGALDLTGYSYEFDTTTATGDITPATRGSSFTLANLTLDSGATVEDRSTLISAVGSPVDGKLRLYLPTNLYAGSVPFDTNTDVPFVVGTIRIQSGDSNPTILSIRVLIVIRYGAISTGDVGDPPVSPIPVTVAFDNITAKPTTIAGYGITDAFSGDYADLTNAPTLATVATSGDYNDLTNTPVPYANSDVDAHLNQSTAATGEFLTWDGADYAWAAAATTYTDTDVATYLNGNLDTSIIPDTNDTYDIGSAEKKIRDIYISDNSIKFVDDTDSNNLVEYPISRSGTRIQFNGADLGTKAEADKATGGYEFTGGFTDRVSGSAGVSDIGNDVEYTQAMVDSNAWLRFGFDSTRQAANDTPYWSDSADANEAPHSGTTDYQGVGLFSGAYMPAGVTSMFDFADNTAYNAASTSGLIYNAATGSYDMSELDVGNFCQFRFDFNLTPQFANTTVEVGLIWATRDASDNVTFTFALTGEPLFYGAGTTGETFLNRPMISAYLASAEDVNARALPAIRADQPVFVQPLTTLFTVGR